MNKKDFRIKQKASLTAFAQDKEKLKEDKDLAKLFLQSQQVENAKTIGITASLPLEVDTSRIIAALWEQGKEVFLAKTEPGRDHLMNFYHYDYQTKLTRSKFGVLEVADPRAELKNNLDLLLVPGLAFSEKGHYRLGFGGGYYDRFLAKHPQIATVALVNAKMYFAEAAWPIEKFDIPIQTLITPKVVNERKK